MAENDKGVEQRIIVSVFKNAGWGRIIIGAVGDTVIEEIDNCGSRYIEDFGPIDWDSVAPSQVGLWTWEGKLVPVHNDGPNLFGVWRKTTLQDLIDAKLIEV